MVRQLEDGGAVSVFSSLLALICWIHSKGSCLQRDNPWGSGPGSGAGRAASGSTRRGSSWHKAHRIEPHG